MSYVSDIAFTETVKGIQTRKGSRQAYAHMEESGGWQVDITPQLAAYIAQQRSFFLATSNGSGQPYIQHRGGPPGFLAVLDSRRLAFADFKGNQQFISQGNLQENPKAFIFLIDYLSQSRVKIWGRATVCEGESELLSAVTPSLDNYKARVEQLIVFDVEAWDRNCPQHIPPRMEREQVNQLLKQCDSRIAELEEQVRRLQRS